MAENNMALSNEVDFLGPRFPRFRGKAYRSLNQVGCLVVLWAWSVLCFCGCGPTPQTRIFVAHVITSVQFSPDAACIAVSGGTQETVGEGDGYLWVWDTESGQLSYRIDDFSSTVYGVAFVEDGKTLITSSNRYDRNPRRPNPLIGTEISRWNAKTGDCEDKCLVGTGWNKCFDFNQTKKMFLVGGNAAYLMRCDYPPPGKSQSFNGGTRANYSSCFLSSDGRTLCAVGEKSGAAYIWEGQGFDHVTTTISPQSVITAAAHSHADDTLFFGDGNGMIYTRRLSADAKELKSEWTAHANAVDAIAVSTDGKTVASGDSSGEVVLWSADTKAKLLTITAHSGPVLGFAFSPRGDQFISAGRAIDGRWELILWNMKSGAEIRRLVPTIP